MAARTIRIAINASTDQAQEAMDRLTKSERQAVEQARELGSKIKQAAATFAETASMFVASGVAAAASFETSTLKFQVMLGNSRMLATEVMDNVREFAAKTPYQLDQVTKAATILIATGTKASELTQKLATIGDIAAASTEGMSTSLASMAAIYGKNMAAGIVQMEDINQLTNRGIAIQDELAKRLLNTKNQVKDAGTVVRQFSAKGLITFKMFSEALEELARTKYPNMMERLSQTPEGKWSTFKDLIVEVSRRIGNLVIAVGLPLLDFFMDSEHGLNRLEGILYTIAVMTLPLLAAGAALAVQAMLPFILMSAPIIFLAIKLATLFLLFEDFFSFIENKNSMFENFLKNFLGLDVATIENIRIFFKSIKDGLSDFISAAAKSKPALIALGVVLFVVFFPVIKIILLITLAFAALTAAIYLGKIAFEKIGEAIMAARRTVDGWSFDGLKKGVMEAFSWIWRWIVEGWKTTVDSITGFFNSIADNIMLAFTAAKDFLRDAMIQMIPIDFVNRAIRAVNEQGEKLAEISKTNTVLGKLIPNFDWEPIPEIQARAAGGAFSAGDTLLVGERGPELIQAGVGGSVVPNHQLAGGINISFGDIILSGETAVDDFVSQLEAALDEMAPTLAARLGVTV